MRQLFLILLFCLTNLNAQNKFNVNTIISLLADNSENQVHSRLKAHQIIDKLNEKEAINFISLIEKSITNEPKEIKTRFTALKSRILFYKIQDGDSLYASQMKLALKESYELDNQYMIAEYSRWYGEMINTIGNLQEAIQHCAYAVQIQDLLGQEHFPNYSSFCINIGELLIHSLNTRESIYYFKKGFENKSNEKFKPEYLGFHLISMSMNYKKLKIHDSALFYCEQAMKLGQENNLYEIEGLANYYRFEPFLGLNKFDSCNSIISLLEKTKMENGIELTNAIVSRMKGLILFKKRNYNQAIPYFLSTIKYYISINESKSIIDVYESISQCYYQINDTLNGLKYKILLNELNLNLQKNKEQINAEYLFAKAKFEIVLKGKRKKRNIQEHPFFYIYCI